MGVPRAAQSGSDFRRRAETVFSYNVNFTLELVLVPITNVQQNATTR